jgi:class 3 adenylate cyclase
MNADAETVAEILSALRQWGWEGGRERLPKESAALLDTPSDAAGYPPELRGWARAGEALAAMRQRDFARAHECLDSARPPDPGADPALSATIAHFRGAVLSHEDRPDGALRQLHTALDLFGPDHFATGQVLDTFGMVYAAKDDLTTAREFYGRAAACKRARGDEAGLALTYGQLGRLALDWGDPAEAEKHFRADLEVVLRLGDERAAAQLYDHLGQTALALEHVNEAAELLDESVRRSEGHWVVTEAYARKDRALAALAAADGAAAERQLNRAEELFRGICFEEGLAHVSRARGKLLAARRQYDEAEGALGAALCYFDRAGDRAEVARSQRDLAHLLRARDEPTPVVATALALALGSAERCRRHVLVGEIEDELRRLDEAAHLRHVYRRVRGRGTREQTVSLLAGKRETVTVMFLDLQGSTGYMLDTAPEDVMVTLNQMLANFAGVLGEQGVMVTAYLGDGFMGLVRGRDHARRGVTAALALAVALEEFNRPRKVFGLPPLAARVGVSTGEAVLGNVGTYDKMDFTALGTTVNLAARLQSEAEPGWPCVCPATREAVRERFRFADGNPRTVTLKGLGRREVWDVVGSQHGGATG